MAVALVRGKDKLTLSHLSNALAANGVPFHASGSFSYGIEVAARRAAEARSILQRDARRLGYVVWSNLESATKPTWDRVDIGAPPHDLEALIGKYPESSIPGAVVSSDSFLAYVDRQVPVALSSMWSSSRAFMFPDGSWTTAYLVTAKLDVAGTLDEAHFQLVPIPGGGYTVWQDL
ncbi:MAG: hypothetical protein AB7T63_00320 [Planctomycetota bacterium]